jgi:hypothetical protein
LRDNGMEPVVLDTHTSILEGSIGAIPRRLMVGDADYDSARAMLDAALAETDTNGAVDEQDKS